MKSNLVNKHNKCDLCGGKLVPYYTAIRTPYNVVRVSRCATCGQEYDSISYKWAPHTCPKHAWVFSHRRFVDTPFSHRLDMVFICDRCGLERIEAQDTYRAGIRGRVEIDDPRVSNTIVLNKSLARQLYNKEDFKDFWDDAPDEQFIGEPIGI